MCFAPTHTMPRSAASRSASSTPLSVNFSVSRAGHFVYVIIFHVVAFHLARCVVNERKWCSMGQNADEVQCNADLLQRYYTSLISSHGGYRQAVEPAVSPFQAFPDAGKAAPTDSNPTTPAGVDEDGDEAMARGSDYGSGDEAEEDDDDEDDEEDADVNGGIASQTTPTPGSASALPAGDRGRSRARGDTMDVDSPEVRAARTAASPATAAAPVPALPVPAPNRRSMSAERPTVGTARGALKQFVGGIFRRNETVPTTGPSPEKRLRSQPLGRSSSATTSPAVAPSTDTPKPLTPRVRTRDERSVDSLRGASPAAPVALDDGKRRARVE